VHRKAIRAAAAAVALLSIGSANAAGGGASRSDGTEARLVAPPLYRNCTNFNRKYPHGVGRLKAVDETSGDPVTTFKRSTALYLLATRHNRGLDRDKDGVACEKA
jgi:hypothetical protein